MSSFFSYLIIHLDEGWVLQRDDFYLQHQVKTMSYLLRILDLRYFVILYMACQMCSVSIAQETIYWYAKENQDVWFEQEDVFAFRCNGGVAYTGSSCLYW